MNGIRLRHGLPGAALVAALAACSTLDVRSDTSAAADPGACHAFSWIETAAGEPTAFGNPLNDRRLRDAVSQRLQSRGMTEAASGTGDCQVGYAYRESRASVDLFRSGAGPSGREPLWHASADIDLTQLTGAEAEKRINAAVAAMFAKFPKAAARQP